MSQSDATASFETLASEIAALCADAIEHNRLEVLHHRSRLHRV